VLGASAHGVVYLFFEDFLKLVFLASLIAVPIVYYFASKWLDNFAFHTRLSWWIFLVSPLLLAVISLITTGLQSLKVALANPVNSLRND
jgi:putative ABC transport system permease protein